MKKKRLEDILRQFTGVRAEFIRGLCEPAPTAFLLPQQAVRGATTHTPVSHKVCEGILGRDKEWLFLWP